MTVNPATEHQAYQPFPRLGTEFVDESRHVAIPWYRLLIYMWQQLGSGTIITANSVVLQYNSTTGQIDVILAQSGQVLGQLQFTGGTGGPAQPQVVGGSPFTFIATTNGTLVVTLPGGGQISLSRDNGVTYYLVSRQPAAVPVLNKDRVQVAWQAGVAPVVTFFPNS